MNMIILIEFFTFIFLISPTAATIVFRYCRTVAFMTHLINKKNIPLNHDWFLHRGYPL